ncbi:MAG TPA: tetratricopeptide repeat protein [Kiritimatiellia bacterium]|jgi:Flp pilus assembly protein TadD
MTERRQVIVFAGIVALVVAAGIVDAMARRDAADLFQRAELLYANQQNEEALAALKPFPRRSALAAEADMLAGKACFRLKRFAEAETYFRRAVALDPDSARMRMNLALSLYVQGKHEEAAKGYEEVVKRADTTDPDLAEKAAIALQSTRRRSGG